MASTRAAERAYLVLRDEIIRGSRKMGDWLREEEVAATLGISRTPVREAFRRLVSEGLANHEPNRGVRIARWTAKDLSEIFDLRSVLEPYACQLAAESGTADIRLLSSLVDEMEAVASREEVDTALLGTLNNRFHSEILHTTGNNRLIAVVASLVHIPLVTTTFRHYSPEELARSMAQHRDILAAIIAKDGQWAYAAMHAHIRSGRHTAERLPLPDDPPTQ